MTLDKFNTLEIQKRLDKISSILEIDMSFEKDLKLYNELFVLKAIVDQWEFNIEIRIRDWEEKT